jgi:hypothetical protein
MCDSRRPDCGLSPIFAIARQSRRASLTLRGVDFELDPAQQAWLAEVREFLQQNVTDELRAEIAGHGLEVPDGEVAEFRRKVGAKGWWGLNWPREYGGLGLGAVHQHLLMREFEYWGVPGPGGVPAMSLSNLQTTPDRLQSWCSWISARVINSWPALRLGASQLVPARAGTSSVAAVYRNWPPAGVHKPHGRRMGHASVHNCIQIDDSGH